MTTPVEAPLPNGEALPPATRDPARKPPLPALSGLRTLLAVNIMFFHFTPNLPRFVHPVVDNAYVFVGFFFLISGFILAYNYADRPELSKRAFYVARASRVYPVYLLVLVLSLPFLWLEWQAHPRSDFFLGMVLTPFALQGWTPKLATFWNTVGWTLPAELFLYALFPYMLRLFASSRRLLATPARIVAAILVVWVIGFTPHLLYLHFNPDHLAAPANRFTYAYWLRALKYSPPAYLWTFTAGILLARLHAAWQLGKWQRALLAVLALSCLGLFFAYGVAHVPYVLVHGALLLPLFALLLLGLAGVNPVAAVFSWKPLVLFGETTFALYLLHFNAILLIHYYKLPERLHVAQYDPWISFAAVMLLALAVLYWYERPARRFVLARFSQEAPGAHP